MLRALSGRSGFRKTMFGLAPSAWFCSATFLWFCGIASQFLPAKPQKRHLSWTLSDMLNYWIIIIGCKFAKFLYPGNSWSQRAVLARGLRCKFLWFKRGGFLRRIVFWIYWFCNFPVYFRIGNSFNWTFLKNHMFKKMVWKIYCNRTVLFIVI